MSREVPSDGRAFEYLWRNLVEMEMQHRGYSNEEIELAGHTPCHTEQCEFDWSSYAWDCSDEDGKSHHPIADEYADMVGIIGRALERIPEANE